jgi:hypothetical protein
MFNPTNEKVTINFVLYKFDESKSSEWKPYCGTALGVSESARLETPMPSIQS